MTAAEPVLTAVMGMLSCVPPAPARHMGAHDKASANRSVKATKDRVVVDDVDEDEDDASLASADEDAFVLSEETSALGRPHSAAAADSAGLIEPSTASSIGAQACLASGHGQGLTSSSCSVQEMELPSPGGKASVDAGARQRANIQDSSWDLGGCPKGGAAIHFAAAAQQADQSPSTAHEGRAPGQAEAQPAQAQQVHQQQEQAQVQQQQPSQQLLSCPARPVDRLRSKLPAGRYSGSLSMWSMLKAMVGKGTLHGITLPAIVSEPTSTVQAPVETLEYAALLDKAAQEPCSVDRMLLVAAWIAGSYSSHIKRERKPFNSLLGETYEWQSLDGRHRYVGEQVCSQPPVLAYVADCASEGWELQGELELTGHLWGNSLDFQMAGAEALRMRKHGEEYRWNRAMGHVREVLFGHLWMEITGPTKVTNTTTGEVGEFTIKPCKGKRAKHGLLEGSIMDASGKQVWLLSGSIADKIYAQLTPAAAKARGLAAPPAPQLLWQKEPYPENVEAQYGFTKFCIGLNDPTDPIVPHLPPTDTRFRPDRLALEHGEHDKATEEKYRLVERQRKVRHERAVRGLTYEPLWFQHSDPSALTYTPEKPGFAWRWNGKYWQHREAKDWAGCPNIFSKEEPKILGRACSKK